MGTQSHHFALNYLYLFLSILTIIAFRITSVKYMTVWALEALCTPVQYPLHGVPSKPRSIYVFAVKVLVCGVLVCVCVSGCVVGVLY